MNKLAYLEGYLCKQSGSLYTPEQKKQAMANRTDPTKTAANTPNRNDRGDNKPFNPTPHAPKKVNPLYDAVWGSKTGKQVSGFNKSRMKNASRTNNTARAQQVQVAANRR